MSIVKAEWDKLSTVKDITVKTILQIYPHYYPKESVEFLVEHHNEENIRKDIQLGIITLSWQRVFFVWMRYKMWLVP